jgi:heme/copper-type cytochrome/quinol oxidase subunit 1
MLAGWQTYAPMQMQAKHANEGTQGYELAIALTQIGSHIIRLADAPVLVAG